MIRVAVLDDYPGIARQAAAYDDLDAEVVVFDAPIPAVGRAAALAPFDVLCLMRERMPLTGDLIAALPNLKLIVTTGMRNASIDIDAAKARGIPVCGTESIGAPTAHLAMLLILAAMRNLLPEVAALRAGGWQGAPGRDLHGLRLGLVGLGKQGAALADLARPFGMEIVAWSRNLTEARCAEVGAAHAGSLDALMETSDVVSIHLVLSARSRGLIGARELGLMKPDALLVNTARGPIVDEAAIVPALNAGRPGRVALDVYGAEPLPPGHPLRDPALIDAGRLLPTPHIGYASKANLEQMHRQTVEAIRGWMAGSPVRVIG